MAAQYGSRSLVKPDMGHHAVLNMAVVITNKTADDCRDIRVG